MPRRKRFIRNAAICGVCHNEIESKARHDLVTCECKNMFVDGGPYYQRIGWKEEAENDESSIWSNKDQAMIPLLAYFRNKQAARTVSANMEAKSRSKRAIMEALNVIGSIDGLKNASESLEYVATNLAVKSSTPDVSILKPKSTSAVPTIGQEQSVVDWFNPKAIIHLQAFQHLLETGTWPIGFIPEGIRFPQVWQMHLLRKIFEIWGSTIMEEAAKVKRPRGRPRKIRPEIETQVEGN